MSFYRHFGIFGKAVVGNNQHIPKKRAKSVGWIETLRASQSLQAIGPRFDTFMWRSAVNDHCPQNQMTNFFLTCLPKDVMWKRPMRFCTYWSTQIAIKYERYKGRWNRRKALDEIPTPGMCTIKMILSLNFSTITQWSTYISNEIFLPNLQEIE